VWLALVFFASWDSVLYAPEEKNDIFVVGFLLLPQLLHAFGYLLLSLTHQLLLQVFWQGLEIWLFDGRDHGEAKGVCSALHGSRQPPGPDVALEQAGEVRNEA